jgi:hypothetical protein
MPRRELIQTQVADLHKAHQGQSRPAGQWNRICSTFNGNNSPSRTLNISQLQRGPDFHSSSESVEKRCGRLLPKSTDKVGIAEVIYAVLFFHCSRITGYVLEGLGADGETRTLMGFPAAPSRRCVCQFHHIRNSRT